MATFAGGAGGPGGSGALPGSGEGVTSVVNQTAADLLGGLLRVEFGLPPAGAAPPARVVGPVIPPPATPTAKPPAVLQDMARTDP